MTVNQRKLLYLLAIAIAVAIIIYYKRNILKAVGLTALSDVMDGNTIVKIAKSQIGVREIGGANKGPQVEAYLAAANLDYKNGYPSGGYSWCAAFIKWCYTKAGVKTPGMDARAASCEKTTALIYSGGVWHGALQPGDVFTIWSSSKGRIVHCGICVELQGDDESIVHTIEGNTNDNGSSNGDGVYEKTINSTYPRKLSSIHSISRWI